MGKTSCGCRSGRNAGEGGGTGSDRGIGRRHPPDIPDVAFIKVVSRSTSIYLSM